MCALANIRFANALCVAGDWGCAVAMENASHPSLRSAESATSWDKGCGFEPRVLPRDSGISKIDNFRKYWSWWAVRRPNCYFFSLARFQCLAALTCVIVIICLVGWFCRKEMPVSGCSAQVGCRHRFYTLGVFKLEFLEIRAFVWSNRIFDKFPRLLLSIRKIKSQNGFETEAVTLNHGCCHVTRVFRKSEIDEILKLLGRSASNMVNFFRLRDVNALRHTRVLLL